MPLARAHASKCPAYPAFEEAPGWLKGVGAGQPANIVQAAGGEHKLIDLGTAQVADLTDDSPAPSVPTSIVSPSSLLFLSANSTGKRGRAESYLSLVSGRLS